MTTRSECAFRVKQYASEKPFLVVEQLRGDLGVQGLLGFDLNEGMSFEDAEKIAKFLNESISHITHTA